MRVYYNYVGVYDQPEITSAVFSSSYVTIKNSSYSVHKAKVNGNAYYENIVTSLSGAEFVQKVNYVGLYINIESDAGHQFKVDKGEHLLY